MSGGNASIIPSLKANNKQLAAALGKTLFKCKGALDPTPYSFNIMHILLVVNQLISTDYQCLKITLIIGALLCSNQESLAITNITMNGPIIRSAC